MHWCVLLLALTVQGCGAALLSRRAWFAGAFGAAAVPAAAHASKRSDLLSDNGSGCVFGEGDGCEALAEGNELILKLQKKSRDNREKNEKELYEKTVAMLGYDDFFTTVDKVMVRIDGSDKYKALTMQEYSDAKKAGKIYLSVDGNGIENLRE